MRLKPMHPGEVLRQEFMRPLGISSRRLAKAVGVCPGRIARLVNEKTRLTGEMALRLGRHFQTTAEFWMNLRTHYELECARDRLGARVRKEVIVRSAQHGQDARATKSNRAGE